jgi:rhodanese-related sulfurtransferase
MNYEYIQYPADFPHLRTAVTHEAPAGPVREPARVDAWNLRRRLARGEAIRFVDARRAEDWNLAYIKLPDAVRISPASEDLTVPVEELPRDALIVVYCTCPSEKSSAIVVRVLRENGYERVTSLRGGFHAWREAGGPVTLR